MKQIRKSVIRLLGGFAIVLTGLLLFLLLRKSKTDLDPADFQMQASHETESTRMLAGMVLENPLLYLSADLSDPYALWRQINGVQWLEKRKDAAACLFRHLYEEMKIRGSWKEGDSAADQYKLTALLIFLQQPVYYAALSPERQASVDRCVKNRKENIYIALSDSCLDRILKVTETVPMPDLYYADMAQVDEEEMAAIREAWRGYRVRLDGIKAEEVLLPDFSCPIRAFMLNGSELFQEGILFVQSDTQRFAQYICVMKSAEGGYVCFDLPDEAFVNAFRAAAALSSAHEPLRVFARDGALVFSVGGRVIDTTPDGIDQELIDAVGEELSREGT